MQDIKEATETDLNTATDTTTDITTEQSKTIKIENRFNDHGAVSWFEFFTHHPDDTISFYQHVFDYNVFEGWAPDGGQYPYRMIIPPRREKPIGAVIDVQHIDDLKNIVDHSFVPFITVKNVDEILDKTSELGGVITRPKRMLYGVGETGALQDNLRCDLTIVCFEENLNDDARNERNGAADGFISLGAILSSDPSETAKFYSELFGYSVRKSEIHTTEGTIITSYSLKNATASNNTLLVMQKPQFVKSDYNVFVPYYGTTDITKTVHNVIRYGGRVYVDKMPTGASSFIAICEDPFHRIFGLAQDNEYLKEFIF